MLRLLLATAVAICAAGDPKARLRRDIPAILASAAAKANMSVSFALDHPSFHLTLAEGISDHQTNRRAHPADLYALGSVTKTLTGASIMRLAAEGKLSLDDPAHRYIDPMLVKERFAYPSLEKLFSVSRWAAGKKTQYNASHITIRDLMHMQSGVPDYDTDAYRHLQFSLPSVDFSPLQIFDFVQAPLQFEPGQPPPHSFTYCSVNFILLGYVLASVEGSASWQEYNQRAILPARLSQSSEVAFAINGPCSRYTTVHGYDTRSVVAAAEGHPIDWTQASCLAGWTGGNVLMSAGAAANWTGALYRPAGEVLSPEATREMYPKPGEFYGLATFNLTGFNGMTGSRGVSVGHLGDTYGFTSIALYFPGMDFSMAVQSNQEGADQDSVLELTCVLYNMAQDALDSVGYRNCTFVKGDYYRGVCECKD